MDLFNYGNLQRAAQSRANLAHTWLQTVATSFATNIQLACLLIVHDDHQSSFPTHPRRLHVVLLNLLSFGPAALALSGPLFLLSRALVPITSSLVCLSTMAAWQRMPLRSSPPSPRRLVPIPLAISLATTPCHPSSHVAHQWTIAAFIVRLLHDLVPDQAVKTIQILGQLEGNERTMISRLERAMRNLRVQST